ncbi:sigma factor, partial [Streptomyces sp. NPDC056290]
MSAEQGSSKVLTLAESETAPHALDALGPIDEGPATPVPELQDTTQLPETTELQPTAELPDTAALDTRTLSRSLFLRLAALDENSPERAYVRDTLIELNLPLVRYAAARFRSRNEPMEDIVQVGTIGLIKAIDRFDCER